MEFTVCRVNLMDRASLITFATVVLFLLPSGCQSQAPASPKPSTAVIPVEVQPATSRIVVDYREYTGRTAAVNAVEIRARVSGYLIQSPRSGRSAASGSVDADHNVLHAVQVDEGEAVKTGDLLAVIDPRPYELALRQSQGSLDAADARLRQAQQDLSRSDSLLDKKAISQGEYDKAVAAVAELQGQIENLKATVARNKLDLEFTQVRSPIDGLLGRSLVTNGNLVNADSTILTTVVSIDPIYVDFNVDEQSVLDYRSRMLEGKVKSARDTQIAIRLGLANEAGYPHEGTIDFVNNRTDPDTGNTRIRGMFRNPSGILSPGLFARIQVPFTAEYQATLIPTTAIGMDQQGRYVMVVGDGNKVARRSITPGELKGNMTVIRKGLQPGENVVTSGLQKIRPGSEVRIETATEELGGPQKSAETGDSK
ncbi:MAG: efflux RND transporter periplasmic adaptor subunit [Planctomycetaceae bacterium]|nr:efflux RND transporter periplasmic adaptor subunit [Planctomycetaceae bacterium]